MIAGQPKCPVCGDSKDVIPTGEEDEEEEMKTYKFSSEAIIEATNEDEAKEKFANSSCNFAANATCEEEEECAHEVECLKNGRIDEIVHEEKAILKFDIACSDCGKILGTEDHVYRYSHIQEYEEDEEEIALTNNCEKCNTEIPEGSNLCLKCKKCPHNNAEELRIDLEEGEGLYRRLKCLDCNAQISEYYELVNTYNETTGEEEEEEGEEKVFEIDFTKTVWGFMRVRAKNKEEALDKAPGDAIDEFDNKSDYELGEVREVKKAEEEEEELDYFDDESEEYECERCGTEHSTEEEAKECCKEEE